MKGKFLFVILAGTVLYAQLGSAWDAKNIKPKRMMILKEL